MEWIKCPCGSEEFKISKTGVAYCAKCMKPLEWEIKLPIKPSPKIPIEPEPPEHPDIPGHLKF